MIKKIFFALTVAAVLVSLASPVVASGKATSIVATEPLASPAKESASADLPLLAEDIAALGQGPNFVNASKLIMAVAERLQEIENKDPNPQKTISGAWKPYLAEIRSNLYPKTQEAQKLLREIRLQTPEVQDIQRSFVDAAELFESAILDFIIAVSGEDVASLQKTQAVMEKFIAQWDAAANRFAALGDKVVEQSAARRDAGTR